MGEAIKAVLKQSEYGKDLEVKLSTNIQEKATAFGNCVTQCLHMMIQAIHRNVLTVGQKVERVDSNVTSGLTSVGEKVEQVNSNMANGLESVGETVKKVGGDVARGISSVDEHVEKLRLDALHSLEEHFHGLSKDVECKCEPYL